RRTPSALARKRDLAADALVVDGAAPHRPHPQVAADVADVDVTGPDRVDGDASAHAGQVEVARAEAAHGHAAGHVAQLHVAGTDAADAGVAPDAARFDVARADRLQVEPAGVRDGDVARTHAGVHVAADPARIGVAGAHGEVERGQAGGPGVAGTHRQRDRDAVGHRARQVEIGVAVGAEPAGRAVLAAQAHHQRVALARLLQAQAAQAVLARGAGAALQAAIAARAAIQAEPAGADVEHHRAGVAQVQRSE